MFHPTEKRTPSATATTGAPSDAKMSTPWCQSTSARAAPHVSPNDVGPITGKTYGPPESLGVPLSGGPWNGVPPPKLLPSLGAAAVVVVAGFGAVVAGRAGWRARVPVRRVVVVTT